MLWSVVEHTVLNLIHIFFMTTGFLLATVPLALPSSLKRAGGRKPKKKSSQIVTYMYIYVVNEWNQASGGIKRERENLLFILGIFNKRYGKTCILCFSVKYEGKNGNGKKEPSLGRAKVNRNLPNRIKLNQIIHLVHFIFYLFLSIDYITSWYT